MTEEMVPVVLNRKWPLLLPAHRAAQSAWATGWEVERLDSMHANITSGMIVYDIGAEEGDISALCAQWAAGPGGGVVLFEPNPKVWPNIRVTFEANGLQPLAAFVGFAGEEDRWESDPNNPQWPWASHRSFEWPPSAYGPVISDHGFCQLNERPDLSVVRVDTAARRVGPPDAMTIDVEGAELRVLRGAAKALSTHTSLVWVSIHPQFMADMHGDEDDALHDWMRKHGFRSRFLVEDHEQHWLFWHPDRVYALR